jgi:cysteine desulfuration protein SufE
MNDDTLAQDIDALVDEFELLDDWEERYRYLIDLGKALPELPETDRTDANKVKGCVSQVWLVTGLEDGRYRLQGDSDAHIVKGLVALLTRLYDQRTPTQIREIDARAVLDRIGLSEHLSPQRSNGLVSMVARIRSEAESASA